jgi:hypothetical protein
MSFILGLILFVVVAGIIDAKLPWPRPGAAGRATETRKW